MLQQIQVSVVWNKVDSVRPKSGILLQSKLELNGKKGNSNKMLLPKISGSVLNCEYNLIQIW